MLDVNDIRGRLNERTFKNGKRAVLLGRISEIFPEVRAGEDDLEDDVEDAGKEAEIAELLKPLEQELGAHDLRLSRGDDDPDLLYAVQGLKESQADMSGIAEAMSWVSRITTVAVEMIVPGLIGIWFDWWLGTRFCVLIGFALGVPLGLWHLIQITRGKPRREG